MLYDLDGVLIRPNGYRKAVFDSIEFLLRGFGFKERIIDENVISTFEAIGITSEWDMVPLSILCVIENQLMKASNSFQICNQNELSLLLESVDKEIDIEFILEKVNGFGAYLETEISPSDSIFRKITVGNHNNIFPIILEKSFWLIEEWLSNTRNIYKSKSLQLFQNLTLGSELYKKITSLDPIVETGSYLTEFDEVLIKQKHLETINKFFTEVEKYQVAITARPSGSRIQTAENFSTQYYPETELAMNLLGMDELPFIGYGALDAFGRMMNKSGDTFVKPSAFHALSSILHATGFEVLEAFNLTYDYLYRNEKVQLLDFLRNFQESIQVFIFEDSIIGIQSLKSVCEELTKDGIKIHFTAYGISENQNKKLALERENAIIYPTINEAFSHCVENLYTRSGEL